MNTKKLFRSILAMLLATVMLLSFAACRNSGSNATTTGGENNGTVADKSYTYNTYLTLSPSNWNELTYQDNNDTEVMSWIGSSFFTYDFKFDDKGEIIPGEFEVEYSAATKLEDVSAKYVNTKWNVPEGATGYAYKITLRQDLKWENGDPIKAEDFVYTMMEQLNPLFQNYRADSFYTGATTIVNAQAYVKQGQALKNQAASVIYTTYSTDLDAKLVFSLAPPADGGSECYMRTSMGFPASYDAAACANYLIGNYLSGSAFTAEAAAAMEGKTFAEIKADATLKAAWDALIKWWQTEPNEELHFFLTDYTYPELDFSEVGIFVGDNEYELVIVLAKSLKLLKDDGSLSYQAAYNMSSLPLVHKATYEKCKIAPTEGVELWTSNYNSSVETTMSWGAYKLESFQAGKQFVLVKNPEWYGYNMPENEGLYQTTRVQYDIVEDWNSAWLLFQAGKVDGISIDVSIADDYKASSRAYFTPSDFVSSLQLQSNVEQLKARQSEGINKAILGYTEFRKALSLAINRADFTQKCTTSSLAGFGLFNSMHYYDVENGGVFRNTDEARQVLCNIYGVDASKYESLAAAEKAITGFDLAQARELVTKAYNEALAAGDIKATDKVVLTMGTGSITEGVQRQYEYIKASWVELVKGTPLEGRLDVELKDFATAWANDFRAGAYDVCMGGWTGAAWDPGYFLLAYLDSGYMYSSAWDTANTMMTFTMKGVGENGADITETMGLLDWYACLNGSEGAKYNWSATALEQSQRLQLIAALEQEVLKVYYTVPLANSFSASLLSYKIDYVTYEYNTFMAYGGTKYMTYNFDDEAWAAEVAAQGGELNYKN